MKKGSPGMNNNNTDRKNWMNVFELSYGFIKQQFRSSDYLSTIKVFPLCPIKTYYNGSFILNYPANR